MFRINLIFINLYCVLNCDSYFKYFVLNCSSFVKSCVVIKCRVVISYFYYRNLFMILSCLFIIFLLSYFIYHVIVMFYFLCYLFILFYFGLCYFFSPFSMSGPRPKSEQGPSLIPISLPKQAQQPNDSRHQSANLSPHHRLRPCMHGQLATQRHPQLPQGLTACLPFSHADCPSCMTIFLPQLQPSCTAPVNDFPRPTLQASSFGGILLFAHLRVLPLQRKLVSLDHIGRMQEKVLS